jgi:NADH-quinone oxidoreductase subunit M
MVMPGTPGFDAAHLLIEGAIKEYGWLTAISILVGNVLAAAFLLIAFQHIFLTKAKRVIQQPSNNPYAAKIEPVIAVTICSLLIGIGFNTQPWLHFIEKVPNAITEHYHKHEEKHASSPPPTLIDGRPIGNGKHD